MQTLLLLILMKLNIQGVFLKSLISVALKLLIKSPHGEEDLPFPAGLKTARFVVRDTEEGGGGP